MKLYNGITGKLLSAVILTFIVSMLILFFISDQVLNRIIDESQTAIYQEKLEMIWNELYRQEKRLQSTDLPEAYRKDFQERALTMIAADYYGPEDETVYPFVSTGDLTLILHPELPSGSTTLIEQEWSFQMFDAESGSLNAIYLGVEKWYIFRTFEPWGWIISFTIPLSEKYADVISFRKTFFLLIFSLTIATGLIVSIILIRLIKPILFLTDSARNIAEGHLEQTIELEQNDEIGSLAESFRDMQSAVKQKIEDLNLEIDERHRVESELSRARNLISGIIESMPSVMIAVDKQGVITQWNSQASKASSIAVDEALGRKLDEILPWLEEEIPLIQKAMDSGEVQFILQKEHVLGGEIRFEDIIIYPLSGEDLDGAVVRIDDVTEKTLFEQKLAQSRRMDAIGQLAGGVAHDFNNMLAGISGAASLMEMTPASEDPEALGYVHLIQKAADRAADLTGKLLFFSRRQAVPSSVFRLHEVVEAGLALLERTIDKNVNIKFDPTAEHDAVSGSFSSVQNALMNLVINASHAMPAGGTVKIVTENIVVNREEGRLFSPDLPSGDYIRLDVKDVGTGIEPEFLDRIFDPFFTTKEIGRGTGLGLASVYGTMKNHKGAVTVESTLGEGAVFHLFFPCSNAVIIREEEEECFESGGDETILLVDDEDIVRLTVQPFLEKMGYSVISASDGQTAIRVFRERQDEIDIVVSDMVMPGLSGKDVFYGIREINGNCPVLIASGFARDENLEQLLRDGLAGFIQKPFKSPELGSLIRRSLDRTAVV